MKSLPEEDTSLLKPIVLLARLDQDSKKKADEQMSHVFQLSDEQYEKLSAYAAKRKETVEMLFQKCVNEVTHNLEEETLNDPLFQIAGIFAIGDPDLAEKHDEYLAETYRENHANE